MAEAIAFGLADYHETHPNESAHLVLLGGDIVALTFFCDDARDLIELMEEEDETPSPEEV